MDSTLCGFTDASALNPSLTCIDNGNFNAALTVDYPSLVSGLTMTMYDTVGNPATAVGNGFAGLTPGTFSVTTTAGTISTTSYQVPVVNFPDNAFDMAAFYSDGFRIKIWDAGGVIYDNMTGQPDDSNSTLNLGGGSIVIHN